MQRRGKITLAGAGIAVVAAGVSVLFVLLLSGGRPVVRERAMPVMQLRYVPVMSLPVVPRPCARSCRPLAGASR